jgi:hypothetical protein
MSTVAAETTAPPAQAPDTGFVLATRSTAAPIGSVVATFAFARAIGLGPTFAAGRSAHDKR